MIDIGYLKHFKKHGPNKALTYKDWKRQKEIQQNIGGSRQTQQQLQGLSSNDYDAVKALLRRKKK